MSEELFENTMEFLENLATKYPGSRDDLFRLVGRVQMDTRNGISRMFSAMELEANRVQRTPKPLTSATDASDNVS